MRLRTWTATSISVARRSSVCERSSSPITRLYRPMVASARARFVYPDAFCQALRPRSAISWRWRSRCVGLLSADLMAELRIPGLPASGGAGLRLPCRDCLVGEPDRQAPTLTEAGVVGGPVRDR